MGPRTPGPTNLASVSRHHGRKAETYWDKRTFPCNLNATFAQSCTFLKILSLILSLKGLSLP